MSKMSGSKNIDDDSSGEIWDIHDFALQYSDDTDDREGCRNWWRGWWEDQNEEKSSIDDESEEEGSDHKQVAKSTSIAQETQGVKQ